MRNAIVVVIDRLGAGYLGPYGNTWIDTPACNRLASESILWETALADCPTLSGFYRAAAWLRPARCGDPSAGTVSWIEACAAQGVHTALVSDEPGLADLPSTGGFRERQVVAAASSRATAPSLESTRLGQVFAAAVDCLEQVRPPFLLWLHARGMADAWDAPLEFRRSLADEEDPVPPDFVDPPDLQLPADADPDEILGITQAYAGQVLIADACLATLLQALESAPWKSDTLLVFTSPRGYPLGERGAVGPSGDDVREEVLHVPLVIRHPDPRLAMDRRQTLVQPADVGATLAAWFELPESMFPACSLNLLPSGSVSSGRSIPAREGLLSVYGNDRSLRTPAWFLRQPSEGVPELYAKPDDRWEVNEVADRCGNAVEEAVRALTACEQWLRGGCTGELPRLPEMLLRPWE